MREERRNIEKIKEQSLVSKEESWSNKDEVDHLRKKEESRV